MNQQNYYFQVFKFRYDFVLFIYFIVFYQCFFEAYLLFLLHVQTLIKFNLLNSKKICKLYSSELFIIEKMKSLRNSCLL